MLMLTVAMFLLEGRMPFLLIFRFLKLTLLRFTMRLIDNMLRLPKSTLFKSPALFNA
jgi:hypothetical protein